MLDNFHNRVKSKKENGEIRKKGNLEKWAKGIKTHPQKDWKKKSIIPLLNCLERKNKKKLEGKICRN